MPLNSFAGLNNSKGGMVEVVNTATWVAIILLVTVEIFVSFKGGQGGQVPSITQ